VTHATQQARGKVGSGVDPDTGLEREAERMGSRLASGPLVLGAARVGTAVATSPGASLQRAPTAAAPPLARSYRVGFVRNTDGANLRSRPAELPGSALLTPRPLPAGTRLLVGEPHPQKPDWVSVTASSGGRSLSGYVQALRVTTALPEPSVTLYLVLAGRTELRSLASRISGQEVRPGRDLRFYEQAVLYLSQQAGLQGAHWGSATVGGELQNSVLLRQGGLIWLPSPAFANTLQGLVPSGSITGGGRGRRRPAQRVSI
jgi:hypothetical protein